MWRRGIDNLGSQDVLGDWDLFIFLGGCYYETISKNCDNRILWV
jgi:hypothetical protein